MAIHYSNEQEYLSQLDKGVGLLVFYADWCGPCKMLHPELEKLDADGHTIVKINSDEHPSLMMQYGLSGVPSMILFQEGVAKEKTSGYRPKAQLEQWLRKYTSQP
jgi:thioredoxin 1